MVSLWTGRSIDVNVDTAFLEEVKRRWSCRGNDEPGHEDNQAPIHVRHSSAGADLKKATLTLDVLLSDALLCANAPRTPSVCASEHCSHSAVCTCMCTRVYTGIPTAGVKRGMQDISSTNVRDKKCQELSFRNVFPLQPFCTV